MACEEGGVCQSRNYLGYQVTPVGNASVLEPASRRFKPSGVRRGLHLKQTMRFCTSLLGACFGNTQSISGLVAEYIVAIEVTRARFPADALGA